MRPNPLTPKNEVRKRPEFGLTMATRSPCPRLELCVGLCPERACHPRLVLHGDAMAVDECGPVEEIGHRQRDLHATPDLSCSVLLRGDPS